MSDKGEEEKRGQQSRKINNSLSTCFSSSSSSFTRYPNSLVTLHKLDSSKDLDPDKAILDNPHTDSLT